MESLLASLEPLLANEYVRYGAAALGGFLLGLIVRGFFSRSSGKAAPEAQPEPDRPPADAPSADAGAPLTSVPGLSDAVAARLAAAGIAGTDALLARGRDADELHALAEAAQLEDFVLRNWVNTADLMRLPGVNAELADALIRCGARGVAALAAENPDRIQNKLASFEEKKGTLGGAPDRAAVATLIEAAAKLGE